ncbi:phosphoribosyltransferase [Halomonas sp. PR-M31]|uniref:phosphoribosyltransferase n=1 Tax=Halomonas sp. PR-M31 TaxID=1471202 RepID=UPI0009E46459|nr:phosphoribosyltransferase family protein [Halomonas sp. PR-M31]
MNFKSYAELSSDIFSNIDKVQSKGYELVVAIPRSGVIPAYMLSLLLNIDCTTLNDFLKNHSLVKGNTRNTRKEIRNAWDARKILIVDDSVNTGASISRVLDQIPEDCPCDITTLAIYGNAIGIPKVDVCLKYLSSPRVFQWNMWHCVALERACVALDGVILNSHEVEQAKKQDIAAFIEKTKPLILPTYKIHSLVTKQPEQSRNLVESWLSYHKVSYVNLIMADFNDRDITPKAQVYRDLKADFYKENSDLNFFVEGDFKHAQHIANASGKPVFCTQTNAMVKPSIESVLKYGKTNLLKINVARTKKLVKKWIPYA